MLKKIVFLMLLGWSFSACCSYADAVPSGAKIYIKKLDVGLVEYSMNYMYLNNDDFNRVIYNSLQRRLDSAGILAKDNASEQVVNLDVSIVYFRRFPGDETPFPSTSLAAPDVNFKMKISDANHTYLDYESGMLKGSMGAWFGSASARDFYQEMIYVTELNNTLIRRIGGVLLDKVLPSVASDDEQKKISEEYIGFLSAERVLTSDQYIPDSVADDYINRLQTLDFKGRIAVYKEISRDWNNNKKLFSYIKDEISKKYKVATKSDDVKEVREAMSCLASSGLAEYQDFFVEIKEGATNKEIAEEAADSQKYLFKRAMQGKLVHSVKNSNLNESWKVNQYARLFHISDERISSRAAKEVYLNYLDNAYLQSVLAEMLEAEAFVVSFKYNKNEDLHQWACRILGESKNKQYLPLLKRLEVQAVSVGVQKYAKKFSKVLEKS